MLCTRERREARAEGRLTGGGAGAESEVGAASEKQLDCSRHLLLYCTNW